MEVKLHTNVEPLARSTTTATRSAAQPAPVGDQATFEQSAGLREALASAPESRPEKVAEARRLAASSAYPPPETIDKISALIAANMEL
jgi:hypothetical protein